MELPDLNVYHKFRMESLSLLNYCIKTIVIHSLGVFSVDTTLKWVESRKIMSRKACVNCGSLVPVPAETVWLF